MRRQVLLAQVYYAFEDVKVEAWRAGQDSSTWHLVEGSAKWSTNWVLVTPNWHTIVTLGANRREAFIALTAMARAFSMAQLPAHPTVVHGQALDILVQIAEKKRSHDLEKAANVSR